MYKNLHWNWKSIIKEKSLTQSVLAPWLITHNVMWPAVSVAAETSHLYPPSQELFQKSTIEYIYYTMVLPVFLLFCTVLSFTWGPKCILSVWIVIYQEFCEILWRVFVLVSLYLVSCIFSTVSSLSVYPLCYLFCPSICQFQLAFIVIYSISWL